VVVFGARAVHVSRLEIAVVVAIAVLFLGINFATCSRFPIVWRDEAYFAEPAVNTNIGLGFTSYANAVQPHGRFWVGNTPLYSMLLAGWLKVFGIGIIQARSFGYILSALAIVVFWWATIRLGLITSAGMRVGFLLTLLLAYGPGLCYRSVRYDSLGILLVSLVLLAASVAPTRARLAMIVDIGATFTMTQLALVAYAAEVGLLLLCFYGRTYLREVMALGIGTVIGGVLLYVLLQSHGVWPDLIQFLRYQRTVRFGGIPKDPSFPLILAGACCLALGRYHQGDLRMRSPLVFGISAGVLVPLGQLALGWYPTYYTWTAILPLSVGIFSEFSLATSAIRPAIRTIVAAALAGSALFGMPLQLGSAVRFWKERDYNRVVSLVRNHVRKDDWVYCAPAAYYPSKLTAEMVFLTTYDKYDRLFTSEEKQRISVMVIPPFLFERWSRRLGGTWGPAGEPVCPSESGFLFFSSKFGDKLVENYDLQAYRRVGNKGRDPSYGSVEGE
jgi:hypothetical protein